MRRSDLFILFLLPLTICGCDSWPPEKDKAIRHYLENRESFDALEAKLSTSKYFDVSRASTEWADGRFELDGEPNREIIYDDPEWAGLFSGAGMWRIMKEDDSFVFVPSMPLSRDVRLVELSYVHNVLGHSDLKVCRERFEELMCGVCKVDISPNWQIKYMWYPFPETDDARKQLFGEVVSDEEFDERISAYIRKCQRDGLIAIGYEVE